MINGTLSDWSDVISGVPQGSVLGPILFLIFINDLPDVSVLDVKMFADDTKVFDYGESKGNLQVSLDNMFEWSRAWQLPFNSKKCKIMHLGKKNIKI